MDTQSAPSRHGSLRRPAAPDEAHVSRGCSACEVNWWPHQTDHARCPMCGADSIYTEGHAAYDTDFVYRIAHTEAEKHSVYANSDRYYSRLDSGTATQPESLPEAGPAGP